MEITIFFIVSCKAKTCLNKDRISLTKNKNINIIKKEFITVCEENYDYFNSKKINNSLNIYLYKVNIQIKSINEKIFVSLLFFDTKLKSSFPIQLKKDESIYFIYYISYVNEDFIHWNNNEINNFLGDQYQIEDFKKFMIFKKYLELHENSKYIDKLLENTKDEIIKSTTIIDYEFLLSFIITLFDEKAKNPNIQGKLQSIFELAISNFRYIGEIKIKKYNNSDYHKMIKILENYKNDLENENLILNLDLILLLFYQKNNKDEIKNFFKKIKDKKSAVEYIIKHSNIFDNYNCSELELFYNNSDEKEIGSISALSTNLNEFVNFICLNIEKIKNKKLLGYINFKNCPLPDENYNYENLIKFVELIINDNKIFFPFQQFKNLSEKLECKDYDKLIQLKSIFIKYKNNWKVNEVLEKLNMSIHLTGIKFIEENKFDNLKIITFIQEDSITNFDSYKKDENLACLISHINLDKINDEFTNKFIGKNQYDYKRLMDKNYQKFINSIIYNAKSFKHLKVLYKIFNLNKIPDKEIITTIINYLNKKALDKDISKEELSNILGSLFQYTQLIDKKEDNLNRLIKGIKNNFNTNEINEIFINILNSYEFNLNKNVINNLIIFITSNTDNLKNEIIVILQKFKKTDIQIYYLQRQRGIIISEEEIYNKNFTFKLKNVFDLIKNGFFNNAKFKNVPCIKKTRDFLEEQINNLKKFNFSIQQLIALKELDNQKTENNLLQRLYIISLGDKSISDNLYNSLKEKIDLCYQILEQIKEIINIFSNYYPREEKDTINKLKTKKNEIYENPINKFPDEIIEDFDLKYNKAEEINKLKDSKIFIVIFNQNKSSEKEDSIIVNETKKEFNDLKNLFDTQTEENIDIKFLEEIIKKIDSEEITKEFELYMEIQNINQDKNKDIFKKLKLLKNKNKTIEKIHKIILLLQDFNLKSKEIQEELGKIEEQLNQNPSLKKLIEIDDTPIS